MPRQYLFAEPAAAVETPVREQASVAMAPDAAATADAWGDSPELDAARASVTAQTGAVRASATEQARDVAADAAARGEPIPPATVDQLIIGTPAIYKFVERQIANGLKADGSTYFYTSTEAMAQGLTRHWNRFAQDAGGTPYRLSDDEVLAQTRQKAASTVGVTVVDGDNSIHINTALDDHSYRTILHEAMHKQMRLRASQFGLDAGEGFAEYLSEIVLRAHGLPFEVYGPYRGAYELARYLADAFGEDRLLQCLLLDGIDVLRERFFLFAKDPDQNWPIFHNAIVDRKYGLARKTLDETFVSYQERFAAEEDQAEKDNNAFWDEADELERDLANERDRGTWPPEGREPVEARITNLSRDASGLTRVTLSRGGRHGVREAWLMAFDASSDFYPAEHFVTEVRAKSCDVLVPRPLEQMTSSGGSKVRLRKP